MSDPARMLPIEPGHAVVALDETALDGTGLRVETWGPAEAATHPTIVAVHGAFSGSWTWERMGPWLASQGWPVVAVNWRGHHLSDPLDDAALAAVDIDDLVDDVAEVVCRIDGPVVVLAHSIGSLIALAWGAATETPPLAMVLIAPAPPAGSEPGYPTGAPRDLSVPVAAPAPSAAGLFFHGLTPTDLDRAAALLGAESPVMLDAVTAGHPVDRSKVTWPVLVIGAADDQLQPPDSGIDRGVAHWTLGDYRLVENAGHFVPVEQGWDRTAVLIATWLDTTLTNEMSTT